MRTSPLFSDFLHPSLPPPTSLSPRLAILDEATSALDLTNEAVMYNALQKIPGLTYLSVGHRPSLLRFHAQRLRLFGMEQTPSFEVVAVDEAAVAAQLEASIAAGE